MKLIVQGKGSVTLSDADFCAQGGEGRVYVKGALAYKVYDDPARAIPEAKVRELAVLTAPNIVRPIDLLFDPKRRPVGYTMRHVENAHALCRLFPPAFRKRVGLDHRATLALVERIRDGVRHVHASGLLVADLNEMNLLVGERFDEVFFIDVDSYQTPSFPATALMESIRDRHATHLDAGTDWFAFAVVTFQLFVGIHPFKGTYPPMQGKVAKDQMLGERMKANVSVLHAGVTVPAACLPVDSIPRAYLDWYGAVFERGARVAPPDGAHAAIVVARVAVAPSDAGAFEIREVPGAAPPDAGPVYVQRGGGLYEVRRVQTATKTLESLKKIANVHERATRLFEGVAMQSLLGAWYASLLPRSGACYHVRIAELDGYAIVEAKYENNVLVVVAASTGRYDRFVFRFDGGYRDYDVRVARDVVYTGINFTVLDTGVCLLLNEADELEVFSNRRGEPDLKVFADPGVDGDARLFHDGAQAMFARDGRIFRFRMRR